MFKIPPMYACVYVCVYMCMYSKTCHKWQLISIRFHSTSGYNIKSCLEQTLLVLSSSLTSPIPPHKQPLTLPNRVYSGIILQRIVSTGKAGLHHTHRSGPDTTEPTVMTRQPLPVTTMDPCLWHSADPFKQKSQREVLGKYLFFKGHNEQLFSASGYQSIWVALGILTPRPSEDDTGERLEAWTVNTGLPHSGLPCLRTSLYRKGKFLLSISINFLLVTAKSIPLYRQLK